MRPTQPALPPSSRAGVPVGASPDTGATSDLRHYWRVLRARWASIVGTVALVVAAVAAGTFLQTPVYRASGVLEIRKQGEAVVPVDALFQSERLSTQYLETQYGVLRGSTLARRVIADLGLARLEEFNPDAASPPRGAAADSSQVAAEVLERFEKRLLVDPVTGSHLIRVHFEAADPRLAADVVNSAFEQYQALRVLGGRAAVARLSEQTEAVRSKLSLAEQRLQDFVRANELFFVGNGADEAESVPDERLRQLQQELTAAEVDRYAKESMYNLVQTSGVGVVESESLGSLNVRIAELRGEYAKLQATFSDEYPRTREVRRQLDELESQLAVEGERIRQEVRGSYTAAVRRQSLLEQALNGQKARVDDMAGRSTEYRILARDAEAQQQLYAMLQQRLREAEVSAALATTEVGVVEPATPPLSPIRPVPRRNLQLAMLVGLILGVGLAFVRDYVDPTIRSADELDALPVPLLGMIPSVHEVEAPPVLRLRQLQERWTQPRLPRAVERDGDPPWPRIDQSDGSRTTLADAFGSLRTAILLEADASAARSLLLTSAQPGEGKTTVCINLALSLARLGVRVLVIDADIRRPSVHRALGISPSAGLVDVLQTGAGWRSRVRPNVSPGVDLLPAGIPPGTPSELLASPRMQSVVREAQALYDFVLIDSPALLSNVADTRILAPLVEGVVVVVRTGTTPREILGRVLRHVPNLMGVVLNGVEQRHFPPYYRVDVPSLDQVGVSS